MQHLTKTANSANLANPAKAWLVERLLYRSLFKGPNGKPLFSYQITQIEFNDLSQLLEVNRKHASHPVLSDHWAACFCLFVAECFRREYDGGEGGWAWAGFEDRVQCHFSPQQRADIVKKGLTYWKRPIRLRGRGRDLLGSLFFEGGLPWLLVQSDSHGFGKAVRNGLKYFYRTEGARRTTTDLMGDFEKYLPQTFRTLETRQLLAGIVEQLMYLVEHYPLKDQVDPASYLDLHNPDWRSTFPIPLDEGNARGLVNEWLKDAGKRRQEIKAAKEKALAFTCKHRLLGELPTWKINTELTLPQKETLKLDISKLNSTRLELGFYEGEQLLAKGGVIYGQIDEEGLTVRFPNTQIILERRELREPISLRLLEYGHPVYVFHFEHSALDYDYQPLIFEPIAEQWWFAADASVLLANTKARLRLPPNFTLITGKAAELATEIDGSLWVETTEDLSFRNGSDVFSISLNQPDEAILKPSLSGVIALYESRPASVFLGWPRLEFHDRHRVSNESLTHYANGRPLNSLRQSERLGLIRYSVKNSRGETLLQRRFGVLPEDFKLSLYPAFNSVPARLEIRNGHDLQLKVVSHDIKATTKEADESTVIFLLQKNETVPSSFELQIGSIDSSEPITLRLPYPYQGARLIDSDGLPLLKPELILDELVGLRVVLSAGVQHGENFYLQMELVSHAEHFLKRQYVVNVGQAPLILNLFSYQNDMVQMLGAVSEQDAYIRFTIETSQRLLTLNIRRYNGCIQREGSSLLAVREINSSKLRSDVKMAAMLLSDPKQTPIAMPERTSEGIGTGWFESLSAMERKGPWLIYPVNGSRTLFRPALWIPVDNHIEATVENVHSLHQATQLYHPQKCPHVIDAQIAEMAIDFGHSGWQYLADLKQYFSHLPLSTFESWLSLSRNPEALAVAVFKLEINEAFCGRIHDELAVIWECIPLSMWANVYARFRSWLTENGLSDVLMQSILNNRKTVLPVVVSGFEHVGDYLESADTNKLTSIGPEHVLPIWYQDLRRRHESNRNWPTDLGVELSAWVDKQSLPSSIKRLSLVQFTDAVTYLPIFIAYVTAGKATLDELAVDQVLLKFVVNKISDFDRSGWYTSVHALLVSYLLASTSEA